jgi:predicted ribosomally synthesized peptide with SipW-like signal peptide
MKIKSKAVLLVLCAVLLVTATMLGTMAYLTDKDAVTNTFTIGSVTLGDDSANEAGLDEAKVNEYGVPVSPAVRVQENKYKLIPGQSYTKDPTVHVKNDSENCYIFVYVDNDIANIEAATAKGTIANQINANGWTALEGVANVTGVYWKKWEQTGNTDGTTDLVVFEDFKIDGDKAVTVAEGETVPAGKFDISTFKNATITVTAYAIQSDNFADAAAAWTAGGWTIE